jgi:hypothetical protein
LSVLFAILTLGACASTPTQPLKESDRVALSTIEVSPEVKVAPDAYYFGPNAMPDFLFGAVGGAIAAGSNKSPADELKTFATDNNISVAEIVRTEFIKQLEAKRKFRLVDSNADAVVRLDVSQYGISIPNGFSSRFVPVLAVRSQLVKGSGQVIWASSGRIHPLSEVIEPVTAEAIKANPQVLRDMWSAAARGAVEKMLSRI